MKDLILFPILYVTARFMGTYDYSKLRPAPAWYIGHESLKANADLDFERGTVFNYSPNALDPEYWENDGVVPTFSQWHPFSCRYAMLSLNRLQRLIKSIGTQNATMMYSRVPITVLR